MIHRHRAHTINFKDSSNPFIVERLKRVLLSVEHTS